jgi:serine/threonine protein kinase
MIKSFKKRRTLKLMKGGRFLGKGSYGCVVSPALSCNISINSKKSTKKLTKYSKIQASNNKTVSKIILSPDNNIRDEITISNKLKSIDPHQKYFITISEYCKIKTIPQDRSNITRVKYLDDNSGYYHKLDKKDLDKKYCPVDLAMKPINLVMPHGGYNLEEIAEVINNYGLYGKSIKSDKHKSLDMISKTKLLIGQMLFKNLKECIRNLLQGLFKMHRNRIVNRDIKEENIILNYNENTKKIHIRYIDYGLSELLTSEFCKDDNNIDLKGTFELIAPEIFIVYQIYNNKQYVRNDNYIMGKINSDIKDYVKKQLKSLHIDTSELYNIVPQLYSKIKSEFNNKTLMNKYFGTNEHLNGYLQKNDVYTLGITLYEFLDAYTNEIDIRKDLRLYDLLKKMINIHPDNRYNTLQCLNHPYFK